jgi:hypothetical protein
MLAPGGDDLTPNLQSTDQQRARESESRSARCPRTDATVPGLLGAHDITIRSARALVVHPRHAGGRVPREYTSTTRYRAGRSCFAAGGRTTTSVPQKHDVLMNVITSTTDDDDSGLNEHIVLRARRAIPMEVQRGELA